MKLIELGQKQQVVSIRAHMADTQNSYLKVYPIFEKDVECGDKIIIGSHQFLKTLHELELSCN